MSETKNVIIQQNNGTDYDILRPERSADVKLFEYWWKKDIYTITKTLIGRNEQVLMRSGSFKTYSTNYCYWAFYPSYGDSFKIENKSLTIENKISSTVNVTSRKTDNSDGSYSQTNENNPDYYHFAQKLWGLNGHIYAYYSNEDGTGDQIDFGIYGNSDMNDAGTSYFQQVTGVAIGYAFKFSATISQTVYVHSSNRNKYPDNGQLGNDYYTFLGIPFSNALFLSKSDIQV